MRFTIRKFHSVTMKWPSSFLGANPALRYKSSFKKNIFLNPEKELLTVALSGQEKLFSFFFAFHFDLGYLQIRILTIIRLIDQLFFYQK